MGKKFQQIQAKARGLALSGTFIGWRPIAFTLQFDLWRRTEPRWLPPTCGFSGSFYRSHLISSERFPGLAIKRLTRFAHDPLKQARSFDANPHGVASEG